MKFESRGIVLDIRIITVADFSACAETLVAAFKEEPWNENWTLESANTRIDEMMASRMSRGYIIRDDDTVVAMCIGRVMTYMDFKELFIDEFSVHPRYQGQGLGSRLMEFAKSELQKEGIYAMVLNTEKDYPAVKFYEKNGFKILDKLVFMASSFEHE